MAHHWHVSVASVEAGIASRAASQYGRVVLKYVSRKRRVSRRSRSKCFATYSAAASDPSNQLAYMRPLSGRFGKDQATRNVTVRVSPAARGTAAVTAPGRFSPNEYVSDSSGAKTSSGPVTVPAAAPASRTARHMSPQPGCSAGGGAAGPGTKFVNRIQSTLTCPHGPECLSTISRRASLPLNSCTFQRHSARRSSFRPVAVRTTLPSTTRFMHVAPSWPPPPMRNTINGSVTVNGFDVSVHCGSSFGWNVLMKRLPCHPPMGCCRGDLPAGGAAAPASPVTVHLSPRPSSKSSKTVSRRWAGGSAESFSTASRTTAVRPSRFAARFRLLTRSPYRPASCRRTPFWSHPLRCAFTGPAEVFRTVNRITVTGRAESLAFSGMNGEKTSRSTSTGRAGFSFARYRISAMGYSPTNSMASKSSRLSRREARWPSPLSTQTANPWSSGLGGR